MKRALLLVTVVLTACPPAPPAEPDAGDAGPAEVDAGFATSSRAALRWKRHRTLQNDLTRALELTSDEVCREAGGRPCATTGPVMLVEVLESAGFANPTAVCAAVQGRGTCADAPLLELQTPKGVHVNALGGNEPFLGETFTPLASPLLTTPLSTDRMVLSACGARAAKDAAGPAVVFTEVDLAATLTPTSPGVRRQVERLFQRLLARDALPAEVDAVVSMLEGPGMTGREFAQLSCFALGTSTEFLFQ
ncbi:MAG: hypothetical protein SFW67_30780 [Myxococcaceae bacterium]|nr:hypothetical protein [Myxococcaceae bacterium]